jgi:hypothetical protein
MEAQTNLKLLCVCWFNHILHVWGPSRTCDTIPLSVLNQGAGFQLYKQSHCVIVTIIGLVLIPIKSDSKILSANRDGIEISGKIL